VRYVLSSKFPLLDPSGQTVGVGGVSVDVTDRHRATAEVQEAVRRRDEFLAMLSHELRNPLSAIASAVNLVEAGNGHASAQIRRVMRRQIGHLTRLLDDLLDVARLTRGTIDLRKEPLDLAAVVEESVEAASGSAAGRKIQLKLERPGDQVPVFGDPVRLQQLCTNLLSNAIRFSPDGGHVMVSLRRDTGQAQLRVADEGPGIRVEEMGKIFELFYQGQGNGGLARTRGGLGVGLSLARTIADLHGGSLDAHSDGPGRGSAFTLRIPVDVQLRLAARAEGSPPPERPLSVVVIEDNDDARDLMAEWLRLEGHEVQMAPDGDRGMDLITANRPQVAIIDIGLPGKSGYEIATEIRKGLGRQTFLIALTGYGRDEDRKAAVAAGFDAHLTKPVDASVLGAMLARIARGTVTHT
jgi:two-component system CheB/CheR fusion protein